MRIAGRGLAWAGTTVAIAAALFALWIAVTDSTRPLDLLVGGVFALVAGVATRAAGAAGRIRLRPEPRWVLRLLPAPWWIVRDSVVVLAALLGHLLLRRPLEGRMIVVDFPTGGDEPRDVARRAIAYGAGSAGPNLYVVDGADGVLVCHRLVDRGELTPLTVVGER